MGALAWVRETLQDQHINFKELHHPTAYTAQQVASNEHVSGHRVAKVVAAIADGHPVGLILPASRRVDRYRVAELLGAKDVEIATEREMEKFFPDCEVGAVPPLRHWENVPFLMDDSLKTDGDIVFAAGTHSDAIQMNFREWFNFVSPQVGSFSHVASGFPRSLDDEWI